MRSIPNTGEVRPAPQPPGGPHESGDSARRALAQAQAHRLTRVTRRNPQNSDRLTRETWRELPHQPARTNSSVSTYSTGYAFDADAT